MNTTWIFFARVAEADAAQGFSAFELGNQLIEFLARKLRVALQLLQ